MSEAQIPKPDIELDLPVEQFVTYRILSLTGRLNRQAAQILYKVCGLRLPEWRCMAMIGRHGKLNLFSISDIIGMDRAQVTRSIQSLVEKGLVVTERDTVDRRTVGAALSSKGERLFQRTLPVMEQRQRRLLAALSPTEQKAFYRIMDRLHEAVDDWEEEWNANEIS